MANALQTTIDKFTFRVAKDRFYTADGVWVLPIQSQSTQRVRVGVTDYFQQHNGDLAFANVKAGGTSLAAGEEFADVETMKVKYETLRNLQDGQTQVAFLNLSLSVVAGLLAVWLDVVAGRALA